MRLVTLGSRAAIAVTAVALATFALANCATSIRAELVMEGGATATEGLARAIARSAAADWPQPLWREPVRPRGGAVVPAGGALQAALEAARAGDVLLLAPGDHPGPIRIDRSLTLWGPPDAVIRSAGVGHTIEVRADRVELLGFSVSGSGRRFEQTDAAVSVQGNDCRVEGLRIRDALFGVTVDASRRVVIRGNDIQGLGGIDLGLRGDAIRFWEVRGSEISGNRITESRDVVVWYSPGNRVVDNWCEFGRYGAHLMYSHSNEVSGNTYLGNLVGIFVMYSDSVVVARNRAAFSDPVGGLGIGIKESGQLSVRDNILLRNQVGIYLDTSPLQRTHRNEFTGNRLLSCDTGVAFHRSEARSLFSANEWRGCSVAVRVEGRGNALGVDWVGNYFDDYAGYDLDLDGVGDIPYELVDLSNQLVGAREELRFLRGTLALGLLDLAGQVFPLLRPTPLLRDPRPRFAPAPPGVPTHAR